MDAGIADTINRRAVSLIARQLDLNDEAVGHVVIRWQYSAMADTLVADVPDRHADRAWLVGRLAARTPGLDFDGPADADWENLFSHFRAEILARRDPQNPPVHAAKTPVRDGVGSR